ncbi:MAG: hypothetical protein ACU0BC_01330 [Pseudooceanicola nanhaiensis]
MKTQTSFAERVARLEKKAARGEHTTAEIAPHEEGLVRYDPTSERQRPFGGNVVWPLAIALFLGSAFIQAKGPQPPRMAATEAGAR